MPRDPRRRSVLGLLVQRVAVVLGSGALTFACFLVLPAIQAMTAEGSHAVQLVEIDTGNIPPPPPIVEEPPPPPEPEEEPPEMEDETPPLDLSQLELALDPGIGDGFGGTDFSLDLDGVGSSRDVDALFSLADLDQRPRATYQTSPILDARARKATPGVVHVLFIVDESGRVENPTVQSSTDPRLEKSVLDAVSKWRFEPGKRNGQPVRFRMRVPISFPEN